MNNNNQELNNNNSQNINNSPLTQVFKPILPEELNIITNENQTSQPLQNNNIPPVEIVKELDIIPLNEEQKIENNLNNDTINDTTEKTNDIKPIVPIFPSEIKEEKEEENTNSQNTTETKENISINNDNRVLKKDFIVFKNVNKVYSDGQVEFNALSDINFSIDEGELVIVLGNSGAGKSTTLNALGGMDTVTSGEIIVDGEKITDYDAKKLTEYRRSTIGFVFQFYNLIQNLTIKENVEISSEISKDHLDVVEMIKKVGLEKSLNNFPAQLSGGEQQRASIARAIVKKPKILLCDEPTGALDYINGKNILKLIQDTCREYKITVIIITHNNAIAPMGDRIIKFKSGKIISNEKNPDVKDIGDIEW